MFAFDLLIEFFDWKSRTFLSSDSTVYQFSLKSARIHCGFGKKWPTIRPIWTLQPAYLYCKVHLLCNTEKMSGYLC